MGGGAAVAVSVRGSFTRIVIERSASYVVSTIGVSRIVSHTKVSVNDPPSVWGERVKEDMGKGNTVSNVGGVKYLAAGLHVEFLRITILLLKGTESFSKSYDVFESIQW
ncbi:hypothetical protein HHI36_015429 [Cryptolaemus montrouzieri]|uniref:Uncharacterized protein n=1 Tax=Cryptolaemus montrouzieri TaxID=559131 RepID=A0ABD2N5H8_9CUCU